MAGTRAVVQTRSPDEVPAGLAAPWVVLHTYAGGGATFVAPFLRRPLLLLKPQLYETRGSRQYYSRHL